MAVRGLSNSSLSNWKRKFATNLDFRFQVSCNQNGFRFQVRFLIKQDLQNIIRCRALMISKLNVRNELTDIHKLLKITIRSHTIKINHLNVITISIK